MQPVFTQVGGFSLGLGVFPFSEGGIRAGSPLQSRGHSYSHGLFAHAPSILMYALDGKYATFHTTFFVHPEVKCGDGVEFAIYLDAFEAFSSQSLPLGKEQALTLDVQGVNTILLFARSKHNLDCDWAVWGDPYVETITAPDAIIPVVQPDKSLLQVASDAPCEDLQNQTMYLYMDCGDVRRIRAEILSGNSDALVTFLMLKDVIQSMPFDFPAGSSPTLDTFTPYLFTGHDYPPRQIALLWLITGDDSFAKKVKSILEQAAQLPVSANSRDSSYGLIIPIEMGGEVYQSLLFAYATIRDTAYINAEERQRFDDFFLKHAQAMQRWAGWAEDEPYNPGMRADATIVMIADYFSGDARSESIRAIGWNSLQDRLLAWFDLDSGYREYSDNYTPYVLESILLLAETEFRLGNNLYDMDFNGRTIHAMCRWFLDELTPQGTLPAMNDGGWTSIDPGLLLQCGKRTEDPELIFGFKQLQLGQMRTFPAGTYFHTLAWVDRSLVSQTPSFKSVVLPHGGLAILRSGWDLNDQYLLMEFTPSRHHQHFHSGSIVLYDKYPWLIDNGYPAASEEESARGSSSMDHSTITLDGVSQNRTGGEVTFFQDLGITGYFSVALETYPNLNLTRSVFWIKSLHQWLILDQADSTGPHELAAHWYVQGNPSRLSPLNWQFVQGNDTLRVQVLPSIPMQDQEISRNYLWGDSPAYGSSKGLAVSAIINTWPIQIATLMTTQSILTATSNKALGGQIITTVVDEDRKNQVWMRHSSENETRLDDANFMNGQVGCTIWGSKKLVGYCLYDGTHLIADANSLVSATRQVSVDVDIAGQVIQVNGEAGVSIALYWPTPVQSLKTQAGTPVKFEWKDQVLIFVLTDGDQILFIDRP